MAPRSAATYAVDVATNVTRVILLACVPLVLDFATAWLRRHPRETAHYWVPDVTEGAPPPVAALVTTIPKIGAIVAVYRIAGTVLEPTTVDWSLLVAVIAAITMTLGNLAAFFQTNVRRLLA